MPQPGSTTRYTDGKPNVVYLSSAGTLGKFPLSHKYFRPSTMSLLSDMQRHLETFYVRGVHNHVGQGIFANGYRIRNGCFERYPHRIHARVVYNKAPLHSNGGRQWSIVNHWDLMKQMQDKYLTYQLFRRYMKPTYRIRTKAQFQKTVPLLTTNIVVFKPVSGHSGKGIVIDTKQHIGRRVKKFDGLLQEFIDTGQGLPGISPSYHDVRIVIMNGAVVQTYARTPKPGSYVANVAQGGKMFEIPAASIPRSAFAITDQIDRYFSRYRNRIYAVDFGFEGNRPYLIELNPQPGLPYKHWPRLHRQFCRGLINTLVAAAGH